ncbi:TetR/AcrR family transcriptional regulator [Nonomuraea zeae]|uniref:TetR/AcrR family transcriptional regulator n=1 Tax=Nonomuraea zeae TaxID=1642303 RepID=A0A5S4GSA0_9ACTN|nr:TetR/AcrR family transcriptional regulator [Nonomuraea zeae]TMR35364.1 TetR/AcrR family transcriptional regulator [Nonomuraea zeae]
MVRVGRPPLDPARQLERAHRILDAAGELILDRGYDKTSIDDVARRAGVAKGTIYLHWKTRDDLFAALLRRERALMLTELRARGPATLSALFGEFARVLLGRPLLRAVLSADSEVLGKLTRQKRSSTSAFELGSVYDDYIAELIRRGAVRKEPGDQITVVNAIVYGFLYLPDGSSGLARLPDDRIAELVADTIDRATSTDRRLTADDRRAVERATLDFLDALVEVAQLRLAASLGSKERVT